ncbi:TetR/AcrR family transcriptional regulator [Streptomyces sp. CNQ085]|uniref:TetR/AcrR family transcriptional regulator n=1 Tax=Streptomyces sp. CNQ085 TaxID=2886944 RepID=UPI001F5064C7|nr:TetR/AcrR family transcriptional regulator [Streptomyces sp. CNQ085]MCI0385473.1 TetR/AcrR family transcriptional regulator [Streptomyces sp. CNQ085]
MRTEGTGKSGYHHGDLRNALIEAATDLARDGGPEAVVLRAAARRVGVSPTAAYRHFTGQGDLLMAVKEQGQRGLAETMERSAAVGGTEGGTEGGPEDGADGGVEGGGARNAGEAAEERVKALGAGYIEFALTEPGLFRAAFCRPPEAADGSGAPGPQEEPSHWMYRSFRLLAEALDGLVATGRMSAERRSGAEITAWAAVHGLAVLLLDGSLGPLSPERRDALAAGALDTVIRGFTAPEGQPATRPGGPAAKSAPAYDVS